MDFLAVKRLSLKRASRVAVAKHCDLNEEENRNCQNWVHYPRSKQVKTKLLQSLNKHTPETQELFNICTMAHRAITGFEDPLIVGSADIYFIPTRLMEKAVILVKLYAEVRYILTCKVFEKLFCILIRTHSMRLSLKWQCQKFWNAWSSVNGKNTKYRLQQKPLKESVTGHL